MTDSESPARLIDIWRQRYDLGRVAAFVREVLSERLHSDVNDRVHQRMMRRADAFLEMLERTVFAIPSSPYRALLQQSGYGIERVRGLVSVLGLDRTLEQLAQDGG